MPRAAEARVWWDEVEEVRRRIERRRASEQRSAPRVRELRPISGVARAAPWPQPARERSPARGRPARERLLGRTRLPANGRMPRRPRPRMARRVGPRPDRIAAWAVWLGLVLVVVAVLSARS